MTDMNDFSGYVRDGNNEKVAEILRGPVIELTWNDAHPIKMAIDHHNDKAFELIVNSGWYNGSVLTSFQFLLEFAIVAANVFVVRFMLEHGHAVVSKDLVSVVISEINDAYEREEDPKEITNYVEILQCLLDHGGLDHEGDLATTLWDTTISMHVDDRVIIPLIEAGISPFLKNPTSSRVTFYEYVRYLHKREGNQLRLLNHIRKHQTLFAVVLYQRLDALKHLVKEQ